MLMQSRSRFAMTVTLFSVVVLSFCLSIATGLENQAAGIYKYNLTTLNWSPPTNNYFAGYVQQLVPYSANPPSFAVVGFFSELVPCVGVGCTTTVEYEDFAYFIDAPGNGTWVGFPSYRRQAINAGMNTAALGGFNHTLAFAGVFSGPAVSPSLGTFCQMGYIPQFSNASSSDVTWVYASGGFTGAIRVVQPFGTDIHVAGQFSLTLASGHTYTNYAVYSLVTGAWLPLPAGSGPIKPTALAVWQDELWIGDEVSPGRAQLRMLSAGVWTTMPGHLYGAVFAIAFNGSGTVYAGGDFWGVDGQRMHGVAQYQRSTATWSALGRDEISAGLISKAFVFALAVSNNYLIAGGRFQDPVCWAC
jgi:hypothetical protein